MLHSAENSIETSNEKEKRNALNKSIIYENIHEHPRGFEAKPRGLRTEPPGYLTHPAFLSSSPPNMMEADKIPQADNDPSLRMGVDNHPAAAKRP